MRQNHVADGSGVKKDYKEALKWFTKAAEQNYADAQSNVGGMYYKGQAVKQDYEEALKWYMKAAEQNYAEAKKAVTMLKIKLRIR